MFCHLEYFIKTFRFDGSVFIISAAHIFQKSADSEINLFNCGMIEKKLQCSICFSQCAAAVRIFLPAPARRGFVFKISSSGCGTLDTSSSILSNHVVGTNTSANITTTIIRYIIEFLYILFPFLLNDELSGAVYIAVKNILCRAYAVFAKLFSQHFFIYI